MLDDVDSVVAAVTATVAVVSPPVVVVANDVLPSVETPVIMVAETPGIIGMVTGVPAVVVPVGVDKPLVCEASVAAPASTPAVPLLGLKLWAWFGNCQANDSRGLKLRVKMRFLVFNMMII
jgi:hypothetical protein